MSDPVPTEPKQEETTDGARRPAPEPDAATTPGGDVKPDGSLADI